MGGSCRPHLGQVDLGGVEVLHHLGRGVVRGLDEEAVPVVQSIGLEVVDVGDMPTSKEKKKAKRSNSQLVPVKWAKVRT
mgnify:CR=1 FL=1